MSITIDIPGSMRRFTGNAASVEVSGGSTVREALGNLVGEYGQLRKYLFTESGELFSYVGVFLNREDIRSLEMDVTPVQAGDRITLLPAVAGG